MKFNRSTLLGLASLVLCGASAAHAAVGQLSCTSNTSTVTANISFYDLGLSNALNIGSQSSGAGAGKVTFNPLEIHTAVSRKGLARHPSRLPARIRLERSHS